MMIRPTTSTTVAAGALAGCLGDLASVLERVSDLDYIAKPPGGVSGAIGAHVRHCLDHVDAVLDPAPDGVVRYDGRRRHPILETDRQVAAATLRRSAARLEALTRDTADVPLLLESQVDRPRRWSPCSWPGAACRCRTPLATPRRHRGPPPSKPATSGVHPLFAVP
jgi:hypothetical protein